MKLTDDAHHLAQLVNQFLLRVQCLPWDEAAATHFASIAADLNSAGSPIGSRDAMIAGHALATGAVLVANNSRLFSRVAGLTLGNWSRDP